MGRFLWIDFFLNLIFFYLSDTVSLSYQQMATFIHISYTYSHNFAKIKTIPILRVWQCSNYQIILKPNSKLKTKINAIYFQLLHIVQGALTF